MDVLRRNAHWLGLWINSEKVLLYCNTSPEAVPTIHFSFFSNSKNIVEYSEIKRFETRQMSSILIASPWGGGGEKGIIGIFCPMHEAFTSKVVHLQVK